MSVARQFAMLIDPVTLAQATGITPDPWQADVLRSDELQMILNCSRQSGKSSVTSWLALHQAIFTPGSPVLLLAPALRQSQELFGKVRSAYNELRESGDLPTRIAEESALKLRFENGSRIICLPGKAETIRGFSGVRLLIVDEAAFVPDSLFLAIKPMLAVSGGRIIILSTPHGKRGFFYEVWTDGGDEWKRVRITAHQCPRISREFLDRERRSMPTSWYAQEYFCCFSDTIDQVFSTADIERALSLGAHEETLPIFSQRQVDFVDTPNSDDGDELLSVFSVT